MRAPLTIAAAAALLAPALALADFEGVLTAKITGETTGTMRTFIAKSGVRSEAEMAIPEAHRAAMGRSTMKMVSIVKTAEPNRTYLVNDERKTYSVFEYKPEEHADQATYTVKRLGKDTVAGYACERVAVTSSGGDDSELCVTTDLLSGAEWLRALQVRAQESQRGLPKALRDAGIKGFPIRWSHKGGRGAVTVELVSAEKRSVPDSTFAIPAGYTKSESAMPMANPEAAKKMEEAMKRRDEAMKNLTPEQRQQMEEMMKKYGK